MPSLGAASGPGPFRAGYPRHAVEVPVGVLHVAQHDLVVRAHPLEGLRICVPVALEVVDGDAQNLPPFGARGERRSGNLDAELGPLAQEFESLVLPQSPGKESPVSYTHLRAHETTAN